MEEGIHLLVNELSGNNFSWNTAKVPGDVYTDLYAAGEIEDPFFGRNMGKCKWVQYYESSSCNNLFFYCNICYRNKNVFIVPYYL